MSLKVAGCAALTALLSTACGRTELPNMLTPPPGEEEPAHCNPATGASCGDTDGDNDGDTDGDSATTVTHVTAQAESFMAVADSAGSATWTHTVTADETNPFLLVLVTVDDAQRFPSSVTVDGSALRLLAQQAAANYGALSAWGLSGINPGQHEITVTLPDPDTFIARSLSLAHVDPTRPVTTTAGGFSSNAGTSTLTTDLDDLALAIVSWQSAATTTWQTGNAELWDDVLRPPETGFDYIASSAAIADRASEAAFGWTPDTSGDNFGAYLAIVLRHAPLE